MANSDLVDLIYSDLKTQLNTLETQIKHLRPVERAEYSDGVPAYTVANLPTLANGGLGTGTSYVTLAWASNGRKSGEGAGVGTGQLVYYNPATNQWLRVRDDSVITA